MKIQTLLNYIIFLFCFSHANGQKSFYVLIDSISKEPIPYAHISYNSSSAKGTFSNELGQFSLEQESFPIKLAISHISYKPVSRLLEKYSLDTLKIEMSPLARVLDEVTISSLSTAEILKRVWKKNDDARSEKYQAKAFYRQVNSTDDSIHTEVHEAFYTLLYDNQGINKWKMNQGRFAKQKYFDDRLNSKEEKIVTVRNSSSLSKIMKMFSTGFGNPLFPIGKHVQELFDVELKDILSKDGETYMKIYCRPKKAIQKTPVFEGIYVVRQSDYAIFSFEGQMLHPYGIDKTIGESYESKNYSIKVVMSYDHDKNLTNTKLRHGGL